MVPQPSAGLDCLKYSCLLVLINCFCLPALDSQDILLTLTEAVLNLNINKYNLMFARLPKFGPSS